METSPYLFFNGNCEEAFKFYENVFGGKIEGMIPHKGSPMEESVPAEWADKIMHACLLIDGQRLMGSDSPSEHYSKPAGFNVCVSPETPEDAKCIFDALADGGTVIMPLEKTFWSDSFGMVTDRYDIPWMVNCAQCLQKA